MLIFDQIKRGDPQLRIISIVIAAGLGLLLAGLWYVQVVSANRYRADVVDQSFRIVRLPAIRGKILDRNGFPLAENRPSYNLDLYLEELRRNFRYDYTNRVLAAYRAAHRNTRPPPKLDEALQSEARYRVVSNLLSQISSLIQEPETLDEKEFTNHYNNSRSLPFPLVRDLSPEQVARFVEQPHRPSSLALEVQAIRSYPHKSIAAHLLGYVQRQLEPSEDEDVSFQFRLPDVSGETGLELAFDQQLRGRAGIKSVLVNNLQYRQAEQVWTPPEPGQNVVLTLDLPIQSATEQALRSVPGSLGGAAVVLDCRNGDVIAMASFPTYDPNVFTSHLSDEDWSKLNDKETKPLFNRATYGAYPPGSIFKIVVALAGLESGTLKPDEVFTANPPYKIDGHGHPWKCTAPAGQYDFTRAFYLSCNCYFIDRGLQIGYEHIAEMGRRFGLGTRTGLSTRLEGAGYFPDPSDKIKADGSRWMPGDTANLCIGQGDLTVTPLQMAVMTAAIANGGKLLEPRLVDRIEPPDSGSSDQVLHYAPGQIRRQLNLNPKNVQMIQNAMVLDVEHTDEKTGRVDGTGKRAAVEGMRICGKTGTAQVMEGSRVKSYVTWFVSYAPFETPRYAVVVVVETEHGSGGGTCAPVAHDIYEAILKREHGTIIKPSTSIARNG
jgi:penicillin-binding protein 2